MGFWEYMGEDFEGKERFGYVKRLLLGGVVFLAIPGLIYLIIRWNPIVRTDEDGDPMRLGVYLVIGLYWIGAYFVYKRHEAKRRLIELMDKLLEDDDEEFEHLFEIIRRRREMLRENRYISEQNEERVRWFGIR